MDRIQDIHMERIVCCRAAELYTLLRWLNMSRLLQLSRKSLNAVECLAYLLMMPYALMAFGYFFAVPAASFPSACILTYTWHASFIVTNRQFKQDEHYSHREQCRQACCSAQSLAIALEECPSPARSTCLQGIFRSRMKHNEHICTAGVTQREYDSDSLLYMCHDKQPPCSYSNIVSTGLSMLH